MSLDADLRPACRECGGSMPPINDAQLCDIFRRRGQVEQVLFDIANGKRALPTQEELRELALKLGVPSAPAEVAAIVASEAQIAHIRHYLRDYHYALDSRKNGGIAADQLVHQLEVILDMRWIQGAELIRRVQAEEAR